MTGNFIDVIRLQFRQLPTQQANIRLIDTDYGKLRVLDTGEQKPILINVPDGPNVIEHHEDLITRLSKNYRVICFELPGTGFSYPIGSHDYTLEKSANILLNLMDVLKIERAVLAFSCSNGFYAIKAAQLHPERFIHLFLAQTPSLLSMKNWVKKTIPKILTYPIAGQLINAFLEKKLAYNWYRAALPRTTDKTEYQHKALNALQNGACFCLSGLVQGLKKDLNASLQSLEIPATQIWGNQDFSHRETDPTSLLEHLPNCELVRFENCGHFPELENTIDYVKLINERVK